MQYNNNLGDHQQPQEMCQQQMIQQAKWRESREPEVDLKQAKNSIGPKRHSVGVLKQNPYQSREQPMAKPLFHPDGKQNVLVDELVEAHNHVQVKRNPSVNMYDEQSTNILQGTSHRPFFHDHQKINAQFQHDQYMQNIQNQNYVKQANALQQQIGQQPMYQGYHSKMQNQQAYQSKSHRGTSAGHGSSSNISGISSAICKNNYQRHSNLQNYSINQRIVLNIMDDVNNTQSFIANAPQYQNLINQQIQNGHAISRQLGQSTIEGTKTAGHIQHNQFQNYLNFQRGGSVGPAGNSHQSRTDSNGPAPGAGFHSSGGSNNGGSLLNASGGGQNSGMTRSRTQGRLGTQKKSNILAMIQCPCYTQKDSSLIKACKGKKQPIIHSSENTANCGMCGQFYAVKDYQCTYISTSGKKQVTNQAQIIKTIRERGMTFKLDESMPELFKRMREVSSKVLSNLQLHPHYVQKRVKRIDQLSQIADTLRSEPQTFHHAVHLMDIYSSKIPWETEYDTLLISLACFLISCKYHQYQYPEANTLSYMAGRRYPAETIIDTEGSVLETIEWQLMVYTIYDYVKLFISQGYLFENEDILQDNQSKASKGGKHDLSQNQSSKQSRVKPTVQMAEQFKKYAEFFADFCLYQECFITADPYLLSCSIIAYTRKYMGVAVIWPTELEMLTKSSFHHFKDLYMTIENKYTENFPEHAKSLNFTEQVMTTEERHGTAQPSIRKNALQLSSGGKTLKTENSSNKPASNMNINNMLSDLKTPDKCVFDFNSVVSGNKNFTHDKFGNVSNEKFQINSSSIEKFRMQKKTNTIKQNQMAGVNEISEISGQQSNKQFKQNKSHGMILSDNKQKSTNAYKFKKIIQQNQMNNNLSDEKQQPVVKNLNLMAGQQERYGGHHSQDKKLNSMQKPQGAAPQQSYSIVNSVNSPSANLADNDHEQKVPPFKPMIIKSNSQAIGSYECKTTTKKSPKGLDLERINALKDAMNSVNIQAKLPSSTTNQSTGGSNMKQKINSSMNCLNFNSKDLFGNRQKGPQSYGALGIGSLSGVGVRNGPIKINQKIGQQIANSNTKKSAQKSQKTNQGTSSSSKKMKVSKSYVHNMHDGSSVRQNLSITYKQRLAEQRQNNQQVQQAQQPPQRNMSCTSNNQLRTNPAKNQYTFISGKPKVNLAELAYQNHAAAQNMPAGYVMAPTGQAIPIPIDQEAMAAGNQTGLRSFLSIKNAAQVIKRKNSYGKQKVDLRVNPHNKSSQGSINSQSQVDDQTASKTKNLPNSLIKKATGTGVYGQDYCHDEEMYGGAGADGSNLANNSAINIGAYVQAQVHMGHNGNFRGSNEGQRGGSVGGSEVEQISSRGHQQYQSSGVATLMRNSSQVDIMSGMNTNQNCQQNRNKQPSVNPPAIIAGTQTQPHQYPLTKNKSFQGSSIGGLQNSFQQKRMSQQSEGGNKATIMKMIQQDNKSNMPKYITQQNDDDQQQPLKIVKSSGSQVLGKCRSRPNFSREEILKHLNKHINQNQEKMSQLVEAAHSSQHHTAGHQSVITRCASNEKRMANQGKQAFSQKQSACYPPSDMLQGINISNFEAPGSGGLPPNGDTQHSISIKMNGDEDQQSMYAQQLNQQKYMSQNCMDILRDAHVHVNDENTNSYNISHSYNNGSQSHRQQNHKSNMQLQGASHHSNVYERNYEQAQKQANHKKQQSQRFSNPTKAKYI